MPRRPAPWPLLLVLAAGADARPAGAEEAWRPVALERATAQDLADLRSPTLRHERAVEPGGTLAVGPVRLVLRLLPRGRGLAWTAADGSGEEERTGQVGLPGRLAVDLPEGARYALHVRTEAAEGPFLVGSAEGLALPLRDATGYLVDSDLDGVLGSAGDGYVAPRSRTVGPWSGVAWTRAGGVRFRRTAEGTWERAALACPHPDDRDHCVAWCLLQWRRQQCGLHPVAYDETLEAAMRKHAKYLARYGVKTHEEDPAMDGYSPEGDAAGRNSIQGFGDASMLSALEMHLATLYHRTSVLQPGLTHTAIVFHQGIFLLDVFSRRGGPMRDALLVYPPHGMEDVIVAFHPQGERPMPVPEEVMGTLRPGTSVNVFSEPLRLAEALPETPVLELSQDRRRRPVEGWFHHPGRPAHAGVGTSNRGCVARVPHEPLRPRTLHRARARIVLPDGTTFAYAWSFETGGR